MENRGSREQWEKLKGIVGEALECDPARRRAFLDQACASDSALRAEVDSLLTAFDQSVALSQQPFAAAVAATAPSDTMGPYRLIRKLGEGGMGQVWLAEQTSPVVRQVALKLIRAGLFDASALQRFQAERQSLAIMDHPAIAKVFDAGTTKAGQPYFVMEYVTGPPITQYCDEHKLTLRERIELFLRVCEGVQHAHQKAIIHRDLKPANILVVEVDGKPMPRIIDFGLAKATAPLGTGATLVTLPGNFLGTPGYMSPEQVNPGELDIDTRTDVYSLGVVLYVLLTGAEPFDARAWRNLPLDDMLRRLREEDPPRPSARVSTEQEASQAAEARGTTPRQLINQLRGDLDWITMKAVEKDCARRYGTPSELAADLQRYLNHEPVLVRPASGWYRARKFVLRRRWTVASAASVVLALSLGLSGALWQAHVARRETRVATAMEKFLEDIFVANTSYQDDPLKARQTTARELLDIGAQKIDSELADEPLAKVRTLRTLASMYSDLGLDDEAASLQRKRADLARAQFGSNSPELAAALIDLGGSLHASRSVGEREAVLLEAKRILDKRRDSSSRKRATLSNMLAEHYQSTDLSKALEYAQQSVNVLRKLPNDPQLAEALYEEAVVLNFLSRPREAEPLLAEAIDVSAKFDGDPNPSLARYFAIQGETQQALMEFAAAEDSVRHAATVAEKINGNDHVDTLETQLRLATFLYTTSRTSEALEHYERARQILLRTRGDADPFYAPQVYLDYGWALAGAGDPEGGLAYISKAVENRRKNRPGTRFLGAMLERQAAVLIVLGRYVEAQRLVDESIDIAKNVNSPESFIARDDQVQLLIVTGQAGQADALLDSFHPAPAVEGLPSVEGMRAAIAKAEVALARGDGASAVQLAGQVDQQLIFSDARPYLKSLESSAALIEGKAQLLRGHPREALPLLQQAVKLREDIMRPVSPVLADAQVTLANCYLDLRDSEHARENAILARKALAAHPQIGTQYTQPLHALENRLHDAPLTVPKRT